MKTNLKTGLIQTVAGIGDSGWAGDGAGACAACLNEPKSLAIDAEGNLFIADSENHVVRKIDRKTCSFSASNTSGSRKKLVTLMRTSR